MQDEIQVKLDADGNGLKAGLDAAANSVQAAVGRIEEMLKKMGAVLDGVKAKIEGVNKTPLKPGGGDGGAESVGALEAIKKKVGEVQGTVGSLIGKFNALGAAVTAIAAGGMFKGFIDSFISEAGEVGKLASRLSMTTVEASHLNVALNLIGSSSGDYLAAAGMLNKQLRTNADTMREMGVQTTDANGKALTQQQIMQSGLKVLESYKAGYDRNQAAMTMFGKGADEVQKLLKLNGETMERATALAKAYGNEFSGETIASTKQFKEAVTTVNFAVEQFGQSIGEKMMPYVKALGDWFLNEGPSAFNTFNEVLDQVIGVVDSVVSFVGEVFATVGSALSDFLGMLSSASGTAITTSDAIQAAFALVRIALEALRAGFLIILEAIVGTVQLWGGKLVTIFSAVATAWNTKSLSAGKKVWDEGFAAVEKRAEEHGRRMMQIAAESNATMKALFNGQPLPGAKSEDPAPAAAAKPSGGRTFVAKEKGASAEDIAKANLAVEKARIEKELALQKQALAEAQELNENNYKNNLVGIDAYYAERLRIVQAGLQAELDAKKKELQSAQAAESNPKVKNEKDKLALTAARIKAEGEVAVLEKKYAAAGVQGAHERGNAEKALNDQLGEIRRQAVEAAGMAEIEHDRALMNQKKALGKITEAEAIETEAALEDMRFEIQVAGLAKRLELAGQDVVKRAQINAELEKAAADHEQKLTDIAYKAEQERLKNVLDVQKTTEGSIASNLQAWAEGTKSFVSAAKDALNDFHKSVLSQITKDFAQKATKVIFSEDGILGKALGGLFGTTQTKDGMPLDSAKNALRVTNVDGNILGSGGEDSATGGLMNVLKDKVGGLFDSLKSTMGDMFSSISSVLSSVFSAMGSGGGGGGGIGSMLGSFLGSVASFDVGTDSVPRDMLAMVHKGERITPAAYTGKERGATTINNHITLQGAADSRTQEQIARQAGVATSRAMARLG